MDKKTGSTPEAFWEWSFEQSGRNPLAWRNSAENLLQGADAVKARVLNFGEMMHSLAAVQAMLIGFSVECLLKGMWVKAGNALTAGGRLARVPNAGDHDLRALADAAGIALSEDERFVLGKLTAFIMFAGRYPVAKTWEQMRPVAGSEGRVESPMAISQEDLDLAERIAGRLMESVVPWN